MRMMTSCELISFSPDAHEVGTPVAETKRRVKVQEMSLTQAEVYQSGGEGLSPEAKLLVPYDRDYKGERELIYRGERWKVLRSDPYKEWNGVILLIRRKAGNAGGSVVNRYA
ncbi:MAG: phage head closure protein [Clostridia bacterium]|nr:phage head closure protein [Clostridia bacterium]